MSEVKKVFEIALDIADAGANRDFTVVEGDNGNTLKILLSDGGYPVDLTGCRVIAVFSKPNGTACQDSSDTGGGVTLCGSLNNEVDIELLCGSISPGRVECELQVYSGKELSTLITTARFSFGCRRGILSEDTLKAAAEYPQLTALIKRTEELEQEAGAAAAEANEAAVACREAIAGSVTTWRILRYS